MVRLFLLGIAFIGVLLITYLVFSSVSVVEDEFLGVVILEILILIQLRRYCRAFRER